MTDSRQMSFPGGLAYSASNAYAYAYAHAYSAPNAYAAFGEAAGIGGFAADPLLSAGIIATRDALLSEIDLAAPGERGDRADQTLAGATGADRLPPMYQASDIAGYGGPVRAALALFELSSSVAFKVVGDQAILDDTDVSGQKSTLVTMKRPNRTYFEGQLKLVAASAARRDVRAAEVLTQVGPPLAYFASVLNLQAGRHRRTLELVNAALQFTYAVCMQFKHALACPRPSEYSLRVQAMIEVPMHPSLPAGHAAEAHVTAAVLGCLAGAGPGSKTDVLLRQLAHRIAENRVVAGVHFPVDLIAGRLLGDALASYFLSRCGAFPQWTGGSFKIESSDEHKGETAEFMGGDMDTRFSGEGCEKLASFAGKQSALLTEMLREAEREWS